MISKRNRYLWIVGLSAMSLFSLLALSSFSHEQVGGASPPASNVCGPIGAFFAQGVLLAGGLTAWLIPIACAAYALALWRGYQGRNLPLRLTGTILLIPVIAGLLHLLPENRLGMALLRRWDQPHLSGLGGTLGFFLTGQATEEGRSGVLISNLQLAGTLIVLLLSGLISLALINMGLRNFLRSAYYFIHDHINAPGKEKHTTSKQFVDLSSGSRPATVPPAARTTTSVNEVTKRIAASNPATSLDANDLVMRIRQRRRELGDTDDGEVPPAADPESRHGSTTFSEQHASEMQSLGPLNSKSETDPDDPITPLPGARRIASRAAGNRPPEAAEPPAIEDPFALKSTGQKRQRPASSSKDGYQLPDVNLLINAPARRDSEHDADIKQTSDAIEETFKEFNIGLRVVSATRGPVITQYELELVEAGMRVSKVEGFEKDLSLKLGTEGIRIVAPLPNRKTIGIEVPNTIKEMVVMKTLVEELDPDDYTLPLILGRDVLGRPMVGDLAKMPHLLVAGATGMGKSVCMNAMICSILLFREPRDVKFIMVDPKMVELAGYEDIPHLLTPPITDMTKAHAALEWATKTMDERYFALKLAGVRNIADYNNLGEAELNRRLQRKGKDLADLSGIEVKMPYIIILVDEYADLMMVNKEVEKSIVRLTAKSRAAGIHIILTTQRPSADVVTGLIKSNLPARISFRVSDKSNSRVVLDAGGAENLLGKGDMLYLPPGMSTLWRGQGVWVQDEEIDAVIEHAKSQGSPEYDESIFKVGAAALAGGGASGSNEAFDWINDRQFHEAVWAMYHHDKTGADFLRRKCQIGYNKATSYVETLEDLGFLGPQKSSKGREMLRPWDDWLGLLRENGVDTDPEMYEYYSDPLH